MAKKDNNKYIKSREILDSRIDEVEHLVMKYVGGRTKYIEDAEDLKQECICACLTKTYNPKYSLSTYVYIVCRTVFFQYHRSITNKSNGKERYFKHLDVMGKDYKDLEEDLNQQMLVDMIDKLGGEEAEVLLMLMDGLTVPEIRSKSRGNLSQKACDNVTNNLELMRIIKEMKDNG